MSYRRTPAGTTQTGSTSSRIPPPSLASLAGMADPRWVHARFDRAVEIVQSLPRAGPIQTNYDDKLLLYSCYKQATEGPPKTSRPGMLDVLGRAKWDAWNTRKNYTEDEAKRMYVEGLLKILRTFTDKPQAKELIRELETFTLRPGIDSDATSSETVSSTSTAPPPVRASRTSISHSQSHRSLPPPPSSVAPSLPGYGPPRTSADPIRPLQSSHHSQHGWKRIKKGARGDRERREDSETESDDDEEGRDGGEVVTTPREERERERERFGTSSSSQGFRPPGSPNLQPSPYQSLQPLPSLSGSQQAFLGMPQQQSQQFLQPLSSSQQILRPSPTILSPTLAPQPNPILQQQLEQISTTLAALSERMQTLETGGPAVRTGFANFWREVQVVLFLRRAARGQSRTKLLWKFIKTVWTGGREVMIAVLLLMVLRQNLGAARGRPRVTG